MMQPRDKRILVVDDEPAMRHMLRLVLEKERYAVVEAGGGEEALAILSREAFAAILCDIRMPGMDGTAFLRQLASRGQAETVIMMSAYGSIDSAITCMKEGAYDYISKPFKPDEVVLTLRKAEERQRLRLENDRLRQELAARPGSSELVGTSPALRAVLALVERVAPTSSPVLVTGETGTGKELVAPVLHRRSVRGDGPFIAVNCSAIPATLVESELFGHVRGAFTGAERERQGLFAAASGGTLFLDEIGDLPLELQPKLLRVLQEKEIRPVGANQARAVDVRVVAATARDLTEAGRRGTFRSDLFFRLAVVEIRIPPLRERCEDIALLADTFLRRSAAAQQRPLPLLTPEVLTRLQHHSWPGNVRELENVMEKAVLFSRNGIIDLAELPLTSGEGLDREGGLAGLSLKEVTARSEEACIRQALAASGGNRTQAAKRLQVSLRNLMYKIKEYGI